MGDQCKKLTKDIGRYLKKKYSWGRGGGGGLAAEKTVAKTDFLSLKVFSDKKISFRDGKTVAKTDFLPSSVLGCSSEVWALKLQSMKLSRNNGILNIG